MRTITVAHNSLNSFARAAGECLRWVRGAPGALRRSYDDALYKERKHPWLLLGSTFGGGLAFAGSSLPLALSQVRSFLDAGVPDRAGQAVYDLVLTTAGLLTSQGASAFSPLASTASSLSSVVSNGLGTLSFLVATVAVMTVGIAGGLVGSHVGARFIVPTLRTAGSYVKAAAALSWNAKTLSGAGADFFALMKRVGWLGRGIDIHDRAEVIGKGSRLLQSKANEAREPEPGFMIGAGVSKAYAQAALEAYHDMPKGLRRFLRRTGHRFMIGRSGGEVLPEEKNKVAWAYHPMIFRG